MLYKNISEGPKYVSKNRNRTVVGPGKSINLDGADLKCSGANLRFFEKVVPKEVEKETAVEKKIVQKEVEKETAVEKNVEATDATDDEAKEDEANYDKAKIIETGAEDNKETGETVDEESTETTDEEATGGENKETVES